MSFLSEWKKALAAVGAPIPALALAMTLGLNVAAFRSPTGGGWQALFLVFAGVAGAAFGGLAAKKFLAIRSPLAVRAESAEAMIGIARKSIDKRRGGMNIVDDVLDLAQQQLRKNTETYDQE